MKIGIRKVLWIAAGLAVTLLVALSLRPDPLAVETAPLARRELAETVEEQGRTRARYPYLVAAPVSGRLLRPRLEEGDRVEQGEVVARIAPLPEDRRSETMYRADLDAARARLASVEAGLAEAESAYARARREEERREELFKRNLVSAEERELFRQATDAAKSRLESLQASLEAARAEVESARARLLGLDGGAEDGQGDETLREVASPIDGVVFRVVEESERVLQAGAPLLEISDPDSLEVVVDLLTREAVRVEAGDPVSITGWGGEGAIEGVVRRVEPEAFTKISALGVEEQRVNVIVDFVDGPGPLGAGYRVDAAIVTWREDDVLSISNSALFQRDGQWQAWFLEKGEARRRTLEIGRRGRDYAQVLAGAGEGDEVILFPSDLIEEGIPVTGN